MALPTDNYQAYDVEYLLVGAEILLRIKVEYGVTVADAEPAIPYIDDALIALRETLAAEFPESSTSLSKSIVGRNVIAFPLEES